MTFVTAVGESGSLPPKLGRYELITRIGQGGMAEVQLALQRGPAGFEKLVVVKLVHENLASQKPFVDMLLDEARVAALVKHPNVVDIYDLGEVDGRYFIAMEYLEGEPLLAVLRAGRDGQRLDVLSTARLIADTAEGLDAAHELRSMAGDPIELVHHDVSLGNIVVLYHGQVKLVDFGVAKATQSATARTRVQGKFGYMAPEKLRGGPGDRRSDIWSLGCVLWEALTLRRLFKGGNDSDTMQQVLDLPILAPSKVNGDVPADFDPIVLRSLERDPDRRYPTAKAMAAEIEEVLRKHGYAAKNDVIARYMQATFADHITARKKLLQEVSSKGRASPDLLEAAFNLGAIASGTPILPSSDSWFRRLLPDEAVSVRAAGTPADASGAVPQPSADDSVRRTLPPPLPAAALAPTAPAAGDERTQVERPPARVRRRWPWLAAGAAAVVGIVVAAGLLVGRSDAPAGPPSLFDPAPSPIREPIVAVAEPSPPDPAATESVPAADPPRDARAGSSAQVPAGEAMADAPSSRSHTRHAPPRAAANRPADKGPDKAPDELLKEGLQAWMRGDARAGLALCKRVTQANPGYGPAWRLSGLIHERRGDKAEARAAFQKYLQVSPSAPDAGEIRERLGSL
jgi:serine/threonine-protein kinase